ncbi:YagK/YfjJ domain-containing protein [Acinetobacter sp. ANC 4636]
MQSNTLLSNQISESDVLIEIENFIKIIISNGFDVSLKSKFKELLDQFNEIYNIDYYYSDYNSMFVLIKLEIDLIRHNFFSNYVDYNFVLNFDDVQLKELENLIHHQLQAETGLDLFLLQEQENTRNLTAYVRKLFDHYAKLLIVRVDLGYLNTSKNQINIEHFYEHVQILRNRLSNKDTCFEHLHGYAWALEQGQSRGYHVHLLLIYDGAKVQNGSYYAQQVGEKWKDISLGHGCYFNPHQQKYINQLKMAGCDIGIGMVSRNNQGDWERLLPVIEYLTDHDKHDQHLRVKCSSTMRTFGTGLFANSFRRGIKGR